MSTESAVRIASRVSWTIALVFFVFGLLATDYGSAKWIGVTLVLFAIPAVAQLSRSMLVRVYGLWFGALLVLQSILSPWLMRRDYVTLPRNLDVQITLREGELPGITGTKRLIPSSVPFCNTHSNFWALSVP